MHKSGRGRTVSLARVQRGVPEFLHIAKGVPNLNYRRLDAGAEQAGGNAVGIKNDGATRGHVEHLAKHDGQVSNGVLQRMGQDHNAPTWMLLLEVIPNKAEIHRRTVALPADANDLTLCGEKATECVPGG